MFTGEAQRLPARRVGRPEDIANAVMFLATTPLATGSTVRVPNCGVCRHGRTDAEGIRRAYTIPPGALHPEQNISSEHRRIGSA
jgi:hypothetical protein